MFFFLESRIYNIIRLLLRFSFSNAIEIDSFSFLYYFFIAIWKQTMIYLILYLNHFYDNDATHQNKEMALHLSLFLIKHYSQGNPSFFLSFYLNRSSTLKDKHLRLNGKFPDFIKLSNHHLYSYFIQIMDSFFLKNLTPNPFFRRKVKNFLNFFSHAKKS